MHILSVERNGMLDKFRYASVWATESDVQMSGMIHNLLNTRIA